MHFGPKLKAKLEPSWHQHRIKTGFWNYVKKCVKIGQLEAILGPSFGALERTVVEMTRTFGGQILAFEVCQVELVV